MLGEVVLSSWAGTYSRLGRGPGHDMSHMLRMVSFRMMLVILVGVASFMIAFPFLCNVMRDVLSALAHYRASSALSSKSYT